MVMFRRVKIWTVHPRPLLRRPWYRSKSDHTRVRPFPWNLGDYIFTPSFRKLFSFQDCCEQGNKKLLFLVQIGQLSGQIISATRLFFSSRLNGFDDV